MTTCAHLDAIPLTPLPADFEPVCADCALVGGQWVHLRRCLECDHVACCDSSPGASTPPPTPRPPVTR